MLPHVCNVGSEHLKQAVHSDLTPPPPHPFPNRTTDVYWVQDFPITAGTDAGSSGKRQKADGGGAAFCETLHDFFRHLIEAHTPTTAQQQELKARLTPLLRGVDFSETKGTLLASVPVENSGLEHNGIHDLADALKDYVWPEAARSQPITYITGALGNLSHGNWLKRFVEGATANGKHAPAGGTLPALRILWPNNLTVFAGNARVAKSLGHKWYYGEDGGIKVRGEKGREGRYTREAGVWNK
jgi:hypothetical protein